MSKASRGVPRAASRSSGSPVASPPRAPASVASPAETWISPDDLSALLDVMIRYDVSELTQQRGAGATRTRLTIRRGVTTAVTAVQGAPAREPVSVAHA